MGMLECWNRPWSGCAWGAEMGGFGWWDGAELGRHRDVSLARWHIISFMKHEKRLKLIFEQLLKEHLIITDYVGPLLEWPFKRLKVCVSLVGVDGFSVFLTHLILNLNFSPILQMRTLMMKLLSIVNMFGCFLNKLAFWQGSWLKSWKLVCFCNHWPLVKIYQNPVEFCHP